MDKATNYSGTQSVVRVLRLLKLFNSDQTEWGLSELVDAAGLNKTTTFRMLTAL
jgi:DNA-binding IclR family transcriptional regulator